MPTLLAGWTNPDLFALALAVSLTAFVTVVRSTPAAPWLIGAAAILPLAAVAIVATQFDLVGWHGFMHGAPMLQMLDGGAFPPEDPLFAGGSLRYPWIEQWLMAMLARATGISPHFATISLEVVAFGGFLAAGAWLASAVTRDRETIGYAVLFTGFGVSIFHGGPLLDVLLRAFPSLTLDVRAVPIDKFANISATPLGYTAMAVSAAAGVRLAGGLGSARAMLLVIALSTLVAALAHPLSWTGVLLFQAVTGAVLVAGGHKDDVRRAIWLGVAVVAPSLVALPYLHSVGASESSDGWSGISPLPLLVSKASDLAVFVSLLLLLLYVCRNRLGTMLAEGGHALRIVLASVAVLAAAYLAVRYPGRNEYKYLLVLCVPGATLLAICVRELFARHALLAIAAVVMLVLPGSRALGLRPWFLNTDACRTEGPYLRLVEPSGDELYQWIATQTPPDAVFVAADLRIPPLARRSLYIAVDAPWRGRDGWGLRREQLLQWHVRRDDEVMQRRQRLATMILDAAWSAWTPGQVVAEIRKDLPDRPLFVHIRDPVAAAQLDGTAAFELRFRNRAGSVYAIL